MPVDLTNYMANLKKAGAYIKEPAKPTLSIGTAGPARGMPGVTTSTPAVTSPGSPSGSPSGGGAVPGTPAWSSGYAGAIGAARQAQPFTQPEFKPAPPNNNPAPPNYSAAGYAGVKAYGETLKIPGTDTYLSPEQQRVQKYITDNGKWGTVKDYGQNNIDRFNRGEVSYNQLKADADRVGYAIPGRSGVNDTTATATATDTPATPAPDDYQWITDMVNNELATQKTAIEQELARLKQESELAVNQNNTFLQDQMKQLEQNRVQVGDEIVKFQNRRGGFYSGGVDYQTAHNNDSFAQAEGSVTKDIAARNADIWGRNNLLAQQAAENLAKLTSQAPDRIRQLIEEQKAKDRDFALREAGVTQVYKGQVTPDGQTQMLNNQGQALTNEINALKLQNLPQELKLGLEALQTEVATGKLNLQEAQIKMKELQDPNSITNKSRALALEADRLGNEELKKRIEQIGLKPALSDGEKRMKEIELQKAEIELKQLQDGGGGKPQTADSMRTYFDGIVRRDDKGSITNPGDVEMSILASNLSEYEKYRSYLRYGLPWDGEIPSPN